MGLIKKIQDYILKHKLAIALTAAATAALPNPVEAANDIFFNDTQTKLEEKTDYKQFLPEVNFLDIITYYNKEDGINGTIEGKLKLPLEQYKIPFDLEMFAFGDIKKDIYIEVKPAIKLNTKELKKYGLGFAAEYDRNFSLPKGEYRLGFIVEPDLSKYVKNLSVGARVYPYSTPSNTAQISLYGTKYFHNKDFYVGGFCDINFVGDERIIVTEWKVGAKVSTLTSGVLPFNDIYLEGELRHNGFLKDDKTRLAIGVRVPFPLF